MMHVTVVVVLFWAGFAYAATDSPVDSIGSILTELQQEGNNLPELVDTISDMDKELRTELKETGADAVELAALKAADQANIDSDEADMAVDKLGTPDINTLNRLAGLEAVMFEGDLVLDDKQVLVIADADNAGDRNRRQAMRDAGYSWGTNPAIPFRYSNGYPADRHTPIETAMKFWSDNTCVTFRPAKSTDKNLVEVRESSGCSSMVGKVGGVQALNLGQYCMSIGTIAHELSHTLGMFHVQSRSDRDNYILLDVANVEKGMEHNFNKEGEDTTDNFDLPYEFGSNMHYGDTDFQKDKNKPVLLARTEYKAYQHGMMGRLPTFFDIMLVNKHYNCYDNCKTKAACLNGGVVNVNKCTTCLCPMGWTGATCNQRPAGTQNLTATATSQKLSVNIGKYGAKEALTYTTQFYVFTAPAGQRVSIQPIYRGTQWDNSCSSMGAEIQFMKDKRLAGVQVCDWRIEYDPIVAEDNTVVVEAYTIGGQMAIDFNYKAV